MGVPGQEYFAGTHFDPQITWANQAHGLHRLPEPLPVPLAAGPVRRRRLLLLRRQRAEHCPPETGRSGPRAARVRLRRVQRDVLLDAHVRQGRTDRAARRDELPADGAARSEDHLVGGVEKDRGTGGGRGGGRRPQAPAHDEPARLPGMRRGGAADRRGTVGQATHHRGKADQGGLGEVGRAARLRGRRPSGPGLRPSPGRPGGDLFRQQFPAEGDRGGVYVPRRGKAAGALGPGHGTVAAGGGVPAGGRPHDAAAAAAALRVDVRDLPPPRRPRRGRSRGEQLPALGGAGETLRAVDGEVRLPLGRAGRGGRLPTAGGLDQARRGGHQVLLRHGDVSKDVPRCRPSARESRGSISAWAWCGKWPRCD